VKAAVRLPHSKGFGGAILHGLDVSRSVFDRAFIGR